MNKTQLKAILQKVGYKLEKVTRFKNHDRVRVQAKDVTITVTLKRHLEETPDTGLLGALLCKHEMEILGEAQE